jgi:hypothetical protein
MTQAPVRVSSQWLAMRQGADAAARAPDLVGSLRGLLTADALLVVHDLACGTGSMVRWLAPRLPGRQHWVLHDWDADLLGEAAVQTVPWAAEGPRLTIEMRRGDVTTLPPDELAEASLVTTSALLDILTRAELERVIASCVAARCPILLTLSVLGRVDILPAHPLDRLIAEAFNAHQRRDRGDTPLLGPDAVDAAAAALTGRGYTVTVRDSPWLLGAGDAALAGEWLSGWVDAACEQEPDLAAPAAVYLQDRLAAAADGQLSVSVHHADLLAWPARRDPG